jgi:hypothetical protein
MSRPLRIEFPGAFYHVTSRGDRREPIYRDEVDRGVQLGILAQAMDRFDASPQRCLHVGPQPAASAERQRYASSIPQTNSYA